MNKELEAGRSVIHSEIKALESLKENLDLSFVKAVNVLFKNEGKIIVCGMGKSGHIAKKISSTFSSIGSPSFFLHPAEAIHGDLGMISKKDCIILISNSGETPELFSILIYCKKHKIPMIAITSNPKSTLAKKSDVLILIPSNIEACPLDLAPTSSTTASLVIGDALAVSLLNKNQFTKQDFFELHPGGKLGRMLLKAKDIMKTNNQMPIINCKEKMTSAVIEMSSKGYGCVGIISSKEKKLIGIITDGDLRRNMNAKLLERNVKEVMTKNPETLSGETLILDALEKMNKKTITSLFITKHRKPVGILHMHDILRY